MADFNTLIADIRAAIYENTEQAITGDAMQSTLIDMVDAMNTAKQDALTLALPLAYDGDGALALNFDDYQFDLGGGDDALTLRLTFGLVSNSSGVQVYAGDGLTFGDEGQLILNIGEGLEFDAYGAIVPDFAFVQETIPDLAEIRQNAAAPLHWLTGEAQEVEEGRVYTGTGILAAPGEFDVIKCYAVNYTDTAQTITCWRYPDTGSNAQTFTLAPFQVLALTCTIDEQQGSIWTAANSHYQRDAEVFVATYGTTTATEIANALAANKIVFCDYNGILYMLTDARPNETRYQFGALTSNSRYNYITLVKATSVWNATGLNFEIQSNRLTTAPSASDLASTDKYPSMKTAADYIAATAACSTTIRTIVTLSQAEYDALADKDANTFYVII